MTEPCVHPLALNRNSKAPELLDEHINIANLAIGIPNKNVFIFRVSDDFCYERAVPGPSLM